ncbi:MAG: response regulator transcription factor [Fusicatenibacter sp.]
MKKIVIAEDEVFMREELHLLLEKAGYETASVLEFKDAAKEIRDLKPDLVLLDINLPGASGYEICRELKKDSTIPVLLLTSRDQLRDELHGLELGADEYLTKPCHGERLIARIENLLRRYEERTMMLDGGGFLMDRQTYTLYVHRRSVVLPENPEKIGGWLYEN